MTACEKCKLEIGLVASSVCKKCLDDAENELRVAEENYDKAGYEYQTRVSTLYIDLSVL